MNIILLGAPFSGKGTLARKISKDFGIVQVSCGDLFRENVKNGTEIGLLAEKFINHGELVPDDVTVKMVQERVSKSDCKNGFILDGFPRTLQQGVGLEKFVRVDVVVMLDVSFDEVKRRCLGRMMCSGCGEIYNTSSYSENICTKCSSPLIHRDDDNLNVVENRLEVYEKLTKPLINFYADRLFVVNGDESPDTIYETVKNFLKGVK